MEINHNICKCYDEKDNISIMRDFPFFELFCIETPLHFTCDVMLKNLPLKIRYLYIHLVVGSVKICIRADKSFVGTSGEKVMELDFGAFKGIRLKV